MIRIANDIGCYNDNVNVNKSVTAVIDAIASVSKENCSTKNHDKIDYNEFNFGHEIMNNHTNTSLCDYKENPPIRL